MDYDPEQAYGLSDGKPEEACPDDSCDGYLIWNETAWMWECEYESCPMSVDEHGRVFRKGKELV